MIRSRIRTSLAPFLLALGLVTVTAVTAPSTAHAAGGNFGLGIILGEPTGFTGKVYVSPKNAFDFGMAWSFGDYFALYGDYLWQFPGGFGHSSRFVSQLSPYVGVGLVLAFANGKDWWRDGKNRFFGTSRDSFGIGVRIPLGIEWRPSDPPLGVFLELAPGIAMVPSTSAFFMGGIGVRYYF